MLRRQQLCRTGLFLQVPHPRSLPSPTNNITAPAAGTPFSVTILGEKWWLVFSDENLTQICQVRKEGRIGVLALSAKSSNCSLRSTIEKKLLFLLLGFLDFSGIPSGCVVLAKKLRHLRSKIRVLSLLIWFSQCALPDYWVKEWRAKMRNLEPPWLENLV